MRIQEYVITEEMLQGKGVTSMPDVPQGSAGEKKAKFDELARDVIIPRLNEVLQAFAETDAAQSVGVRLPNGLAVEPTLQAYMDTIYQTLQSFNAVTLVYNALPESGTALENKAEYLPVDAVGTYEFNFPEEGESWVRFTAAAEFAITFAAGTRFLNGAPVFEAEGVYELHGKDGVVAVGKVVTA